MTERKRRGWGENVYRAWRAEQERDAEIARLKEALAASQRMIWFLVKQSGGKVAIDRTTIDDFDPIRAALITTPDPTTGAMVVETAIQHLR